MFMTTTPPSMPWQNYGIFILETLVALAVVALAAWLITRYGWAHFFGRSKHGRMKVVERLALDPKRSVYLIEVDGETLLVGSGDGVRLLKKMDTNQGKKNRGEI
jgi:flagellar biosynthetic protein FliO